MGKRLGICPQLDSRVVRRGTSHQWNLGDKSHTSHRLFRLGDSARSIPGPTVRFGQLSGQVGYDAAHLSTRPFQPVASSAGASWRAAASPVIMSDAPVAFLLKREKNTMLRRSCAPPLLFLGEADAVSGGRNCNQMKECSAWVVDCEGMLCVGRGLLECSAWVVDC